MVRMCRTCTQVTSSDNCTRPQVKSSDNCTRCIQDSQVSAILKIIRQLVTLSQTRRTAPRPLPRRGTASRLGTLPRWMLGRLGDGELAAGNCTWPMARGSASRPEAIPLCECDCLRFNLSQCYVRLRPKKHPRFAFDVTFSVS